jgi:hypothetical protein
VITSAKVWPSAPRAGGMAPISENDRRKICYGNAAALCGLPRSVDDWTAARPRAVMLHTQAQAEFSSSRTVLARLIPPEADFLPGRNGYGPVQGWTPASASRLKQPRHRRHLAQEWLNPRPGESVIRLHVGVGPMPSRAWATVVSSAARTRSHAQVSSGPRWRSPRW